MTKLKFSKTRVVYWEAGRSTFTLPANANTLPAGVTLLEDNTLNQALPYRIAKAVGTQTGDTTIGHQWHSIPYNYYGLYCTPSEINALWENSNSITPLSMNYTVGHTIPLSRTATASTTQLSFNNTIYSLIVDLPGQDHISIGLEFPSVLEMNNFCRTFDGSRYDNLERAVLPIPDIFFKVPRVKSNPHFAVLAGGTGPTLTSPNGNVNFLPSAGLPDHYSQDGAVNAYLPELLQNNSNVKVLYPGENQDMFNFDCMPYKTLATIPTDVINFNETWANQDSRNTLLNTNAQFPSALILHMSVVPVLRGPRALFTVGSRDTPYDNNVTAGTAAQDLDKTLWSEILQSKNGMHHMDTYTNSIPTKFIKCLPIMAQDNLAVNHTICGTITWTLEVEVTDRLYKNVNPYKWEMLWPYRYNILTATEGAVSSVLTQEAMISSSGMRPLNDEHWKDLQLRRRNPLDLRADNIANPNTTSYQPPLVRDLTVDYAYPINTEQDIGYYTSAAFNDLHTAAFGSGNYIQTRSRTRKAKANAKE